MRVRYHIGVNKKAKGGKVFAVLLAVAAYVLMLVLPLDLPAEQQRVLALLVLVAILWLSEALPLFVTALLIPIVLVVSIGTDQRVVLQAFADPIIALFFGSFVLAIALARNGLDQRIARVLTRVTRGSANGLVLGFVVLAALLGMWISNTATVSLLVPVALLFITRGRVNKRAPRLAKALLFACAVGAAIGGMATLVGTPPNAIAARYLAAAGEPISFVGWLAFGVPLMVLLIPIVWIILLLVWKPELRRLRPIELPSKRWRKKELGTVAVLLATIAMWLTEPLHGVPPAMVALAAAIICFASGLLRTADLSKVPYQALILFGGGLALGDAMVATGFTVSIVDALTGLVATQNMLGILAVLMLLAIALTTVASNTATAALLVPIVLSIAASSGLDPTPLVVGATLALSVDFISPVGTPPAALIHSTGLVHVRDFLRSGSIVTAAAATLIFVVVALTL